jgi:uncharacterized protein with PIN domain
VNPRNLEGSLGELCRLYSLKPAASELLTRCVKCNGRILKVDESHRVELRQRSDVPAALVAHGATIELFCCNGCQQVSAANQRAIMLLLEFETSDSLCSR